MRYSYDEKDTGYYTSTGKLVYVRTWKFDFTLSTSSNPQEKVFTTEGVIDELVDGSGWIYGQASSFELPVVLTLPSIIPTSNSIGINAQVYRNAAGNLVLHILATNMYNGTYTGYFTAHYTKTGSGKDDLQ